MRYPTPSAYQEAVQYPATAFSDPELQRAEPVWTPLGLPKSITGAFAVVFKMQGDAGEQAVRCPLAEIPDAESRYARLATQASELPGYVPSRYITRGIQVEGQWFPTLVMPWLEAMPLHRFVATNRHRPDMLRACAEALRGVMAAWHAAGIAHGDLQHGNILVEGNSADALRLHLIDYDAVGFGPKAKTAHEAGHRNYSHPEAPASPLQRDQFALLVISTALRAVEAEPSWWDAYDSGENLLFSASDLYDPAQSPLFQALWAHPEVGPYARLLAAAALGPASRIPAWEDSGTADVPIPQERTPDAQRRARIDWVTILPFAAFGGMAIVFHYVWFCVGFTWLFVRFVFHPETKRARRSTAALRLLRRELREAEAQLRAVEAEQERVQNGIERAREARLKAVREDYFESCLKHHLMVETLEVEGVSFKAMVRIKGAGIRNAWLATPERLAQVSDLAEATRISVGFWRNSLLAQYAAGCPDTLSEAELRRLGRQREHRLAEISQERERLSRRLEALQQEQSMLKARVALSKGKVLKRVFVVLPEERPDAPAPRPTPQGVAIPLEE